MKLFFHKLTNWEYWPFQVLYIPVFVQWFFYGLRARTFFFFNVSNPNIVNGGFIMESKKEIYDLIPKQYYPNTILIKSNCPIDEVINAVEKAGINFPIITKPDIGLRGLAVKKNNSKEELLAYHQKATFDYILQDFIPFNNEIGIFYVRFPNETHGKITGIVGKEFLIITGNGKDTIYDFLNKNARYRFQISALEKEYGKEYLNTILPKDKKVNLVPYGNHSRGTKFIDVSHKITDKLTKQIDNICQQIPLYYIGRIDLMFNSWEELENGQNFSIVELNGASSEPTHVYDPKHSIFFAWKEIILHMHYLYKISKQNKAKGFRYMTNKEGLKQYKLHLANNQSITNF